MSESVIAALEVALQSDPDNLDLLLHLGALYQGSQRSAEAAQLAARALAIQPDNIDAIGLGADAAASLGDSDKAASYRRLLGSLAPSEPAEPTPPPPAPTGAAPPAESSPPRPARIPAAGQASPESAEELFELWDEVDAKIEPDFGELGDPEMTLADVAGLEAVKRQLELSFLGPMRNPELLEAFGKTLGGGMLLWGPPGCGKTFIARAIAGEMGAKFYNIRLSDVLDMWIGSSERNVASIFEVARRAAPCVIFFDEIDAIGRKRSDQKATGTRNVVNQMLTEMDGLDADNTGVFFLGATNHVWDLDPALMRPGRFDRSLLVLPPDLEARQAIAEFHLRDRPTEQIDTAGLAKATDGLSGADIALVVEAATEQALSDSISSGVPRPITNKDLKQARKELGASSTSWFETAKNYALYSNDSGKFDDLLDYIKRHRI